MNIVKKTIELSDGRIIEIETGKLAKQADGSVVVKMGGTMLLATVTCAKDAKEDVDFMPLQVDYKEKYASAGRFPGGFMKREGKASDYEILISRLIDRALRPLFPEDFHAEVFVNVNLISAEKDIQPDALAGLAASSASTLSSITEGHNVKGSIGSRSNTNTYNTWRCEYYEPETSNPDNANYIATCGRPFEEVDLISNHSGYIECSNASVTGAMFDSERNAVNSYLNSGFYLE